MRRYKFLEDKEVYEALNKVRDAFLAARNGDQVNKIIDGLLTHDEKLKIGRRILIAEYLTSGFTINEISKILRVGKNTIMHISRRIEKHDEWLDLIDERSKKVEKEYQKRKYKPLGSSTKIFKTNAYTGFKRKDVKRA